MAILLETDRLMLRDFTPNDAEALHLAASDPDVVQHMDWQPNTPEQTRDFIEQQLHAQTQKDRAVFELAIVEKSTRRLIGGCGLTLDHGIGVIGYCLAKTAWGQGYGTEVATTLVEWGTRTHNLTQIRATCATTNLASRRVLEKAGLGLINEQKGTLTFACQK